MKLPRLRFILVGLLLGVGFIALAAVRIDFHRVLGVLEHVQALPWIPLALTSYVCGHVTRGARLRRLVSREAMLTLPTSTGVVVVGYAVNNILPARLGELARAWMLTERSGLSIFQTLTVTLLERVLDGLTLLLLFGITILMLPARPASAATLEVAGALFGISVLAIATGVIAPGFLLSSVSRFANRFMPRLHDRLVIWASAILNGLAYLRQPIGAMAVAALGVLAWLFEAGLFFFLLPALGMPLSAPRALLAMTWTNLGILLPSTPGFIGPFHFFCAQAMQSTGANADIAFAYAVLVHLTFYVSVTLWGLAVLAAHGLSVGRALSLSTAARSFGGRALAGSGSRLGERSSHQTATRTSDFMRALTDSALPLDADGITGEERHQLVSEVAEFIQGQLEMLPMRLRVLFAVGVAGFRGATRVLHGRSFSSIDPVRRRAWFEEWAYGRLTLARQLFKSVRSLALLSYYEQPAARRVLQQRATPDAGRPGQA